LHVRLTDLGSERIGPRLLRRGDHLQSRPPLLSRAQQLRAPVGRVGFIACEAIGDQDIRDPLHGLSRDPPPARDLGDSR
jgi:hypothetical protein